MQHVVLQTATPKSARKLLPCSTLSCRQPLIRLRMDIRGPSSSGRCNCSCLPLSPSERNEVPSVRHCQLRCGHGLKAVSFDQRASSESHRVARARESGDTVNKSFTKEYAPQIIQYTGDASNAKLHAQIKRAGNTLSLIQAAAHGVSLPA